MDLKSMEALYSKPGFMIRRAHQIAAAVFDEASGPLSITTTQYSVLHTLRVRPDIDQIGLCALIGIDRSTAAAVLRLLEQNGLVERRSHAQDRRRKILNLTPRGHALLDRCGPLTHAVHDAMREALSEEELAQLLSLLGKFVSAFNARVRNPLIGEDDAD